MKETEMIIKRNKYGKVIWTDEMIDFIKVNHGNMTNKKLAETMGMKVTLVRSRAYELGLYHMRLEYWTKEQIDFLQAYYEIMGDVELAELFNQIWTKSKGWTKKHIEKKRRYLKLKRTTAQKDYIRDRNTHQGRFSVSHWKRWIGRTRKDGDTVVWNVNNKKAVYIKWSGGRFGTYDKLSHITWLLNYGPIPEGMNIMHLDGDYSNCQIENLIMVANDGLATMNGIIMTDAYVLGRMVYKNPSIKETILNELPALIEMKRIEIKLNRKIKNYAKKQAQ